MNANGTKPNRLLKKGHATFQRGDAGLPDQRDSVPLDGEFFSEAVELLAGLGYLKNEFGKRSIQQPGDLSRQIIDRIGCHVKGMDAATLRLIQSILVEFSRYLMIYGTEGGKNAHNNRAYSLIRILSQAQSQRQMLQSLLEIKQFCRDFSALFPEESFF